MDLPKAWHYAGSDYLIDTTWTVHAHGITYKLDALERELILCAFNPENYGPDPEVWATWTDYVLLDAGKIRVSDITGNYIPN